MTITLELDGIGCPFCGAKPDRLKQEDVPPECRHFESARVKHKPNCWLGRETLLTPMNIQRWKRRDDSTEKGARL